MKCPKCESENVQIGTIADGRTKVRTILLWVIWLLIAMLLLLYRHRLLAFGCALLPLAITIARPTEPKTAAICQACAHKWSIGNSDNLAKHIAVNLGAVVLFLGTFNALVLSPPKLYNPNHSATMSASGLDVSTNEKSILYSASVENLFLKSDYDGNDVLIFEIKFTNESDQTTTPNDCYRVVAFQNDVELSDSFVVNDFEEDISGLDAHKEIRPNGTLTYYLGFKLIGDTTVETEFRERSKLGGAVQTLTFEPSEILFPNQDEQSIPEALQILKISTVSHKFHRARNYVSYLELSVLFENLSNEDISPASCLFPIATQNGVALEVLPFDESTFDPYFTLHTGESAQITYQFNVQYEDLPIEFSMREIATNAECFSETMPFAYYWDN